MTDGGVGIHVTTLTVIGNNPLALCSGFAGSLGIANPTASGALLQLLASKWYARGRGRSRVELDADDLTDAPGATSEESEDTNLPAISQKPPVASLVEELENGGAVAGMDERAYVNTSLSDVSQPLATVSEGGINTNNLYLFDGVEDSLTSMFEPLASEASPEINLMAGISEPEDDSAQFNLEPQGLPVVDAGIFSALPLAEGESTYGFDGRGSVTAAFDVKGELLGSAAFSIAGTIEASFGDLPSRGWNAEETDSTTGLVYLRARFLMSGTLSFASQDTYLGQVTNPNSQNRYAFAEGDPVNATDPSGHFKLPFTVPKSIPMLQREYQYKQEAQRRQQEALIARKNPSILPNVYARREQYRYEHPNGPGSYRSGAYSPGVQQSYSEQMIATMPESSERSYYAWTWYKNGWITQEAAKKYCTGVLKMDLESQRLSTSTNQLQTAVDGFTTGISSGTELTRGSLEVGNQAGKLITGVGDYGKDVLVSTSDGLMKAGSKFTYTGVILDGGFTAIEINKIWNNPDIPPDRATTDTFVEAGYAGAKITTVLLVGAAAASAVTPIGILVGVIAVVAVGVGGIALDNYVSNEKLKNQWKDGLYGLWYG